MRSFRLAFLLPLFFVAQLASAAQTISIVVDASGAPRDIVHARMTFPATAGPLSFYYPKWIPGEHGPTGPLVQTAGLRITSNEEVITWTRNPREMYQMNVTVPQGAKSVSVDLDYLDPSGSGQFSGGGSMTPRVAIISWNTLLLYPAGKTSEELKYEPVLRIPARWKYATALETLSREGDEIRFEPVTLTRLVDSPVLIGAYLHKVDLPSSASSLRHTINIGADSEAAATPAPEFASQYGRLVDEARALFGAEHFRHYDWLVTLSENVQHFGLEHHESSDNRMPEATLEEEATRRGLAGLLSHEYMHSWNGKHRRPTGLTVTNYDQPMTGELLWVYEGLTTHLGDLLAERSGLWTPFHYRESLALIASQLSSNAGRSWRPLEDTAVEAQILYEAPTAWSAYRRGVDFYDEGLLLWIDADMTIRKLTANKRSLDDFCRRFFGGADRDPVVKPYTFDDLVRALNEVAPNDWTSFLNTRLRSTTSAPLGGIETSGWRLVYNDEPNEAQAANEKRRKSGDYTTSLGFTVGESGKVSDVIPGSLAAAAGVNPASTLVAVNGRKFSLDALRIAVRDSKKAKEPMQLIVATDDFMNVTTIDYHGGFRYPHLERIPDTPDWLAEMGKSRGAKEK